MVIDTTGSEDAWQRQALIEVSDGTSVMLLHALTETINIEGGERGLDKIDLLNLGQIPKHGAGDVYTITFEGYPLAAGVATAGAAGGFWEFFANKPVADASEPLDIDLTNTLTRYRVAILWTDDVTATAGGGATASSTAGLRFVIADCFAVGAPVDFTDKIVKTTLMFKGVGFDKTGAATDGNNVKMESALNTAIPTLGNYTPSSTKWA